MPVYKSVLMGELSAKGIYYEGGDDVEVLERLYNANGIPLPAEPEEGWEEQPEEVVEEIVEGEDDAADQEPENENVGKPKKKKGIVEKLIGKK